MSVASKDGAAVSYFLQQCSLEFACCWRLCIYSRLVMQGRFCGNSLFDMLHIFLLGAVCFFQTCFGKHIVVSGMALPCFFSHACVGFGRSLWNGSLAASWPEGSGEPEQHPKNRKVRSIETSNADFLRCTAPRSRALFAMWQISGLGS